MAPQRPALDVRPPMSLGTNETITAVVTSAPGTHSSSAPPQMPRLSEPPSGASASLVAHASARPSANPSVPAAPVERASSRRSGSSGARIAAGGGAVIFLAIVIGAVAGRRASSTGAAATGVPAGDTVPIAAVTANPTSNEAAASATASAASAPTATPSTDPSATASSAATPVPSGSATADAPKAPAAPGGKSPLKKPIRSKYSQE